MKKEFADCAGRSACALCVGFAVETYTSCILRSTKQLLLSEVDTAAGREAVSKFALQREGALQ